eukprot:gene7268-6849_t
MGDSGDSSPPNSAMVLSATVGPLLLSALVERVNMTSTTDDWSSASKRGQFEINMDDGHGVTRRSEALPAATGATAPTTRDAACMQGPEAPTDRQASVTPQTKKKKKKKRGPGARWCYSSHRARTPTSFAVVP